MMLETAQGDPEYSVILEGDVLISPLYLDYITWCIRIFLTIPPESVKDNLFGCSLHSPLVDKTQPTQMTDLQKHHVKTPLKNISKEKYLFYFQMPSSWGAIYRKNMWKDYLVYLQTHIDKKIRKKVSNPRFNSQTKSWKM